MAKYILKNTSLFIGIDYYPEGSILNLSEREAERINNSISAGYLEIISEEKPRTKELENHEIKNPEIDNSEFEIPVRAQRPKRSSSKKEKTR
ncbi:hypothetical protein APF79_10260 [bacterium BRH_c32]|nr:MAG: hypothetical protein APF79_10260 [bacterium BRH_c32]